MNATTLILDLKNKGINISLTDGKLKINAPEGVLND
jgi:uncharacterized membrane protein